MSYDQMTLQIAQACYAAATDDLPGGKAQAVSRIQVMLNELLDSERLAYRPPKVAGYTAQPDAKIALVNGLKQDEERLLRKIDELAAVYHDEEQLWPNGDHVSTKLARVPSYDKRWLAIARTHFQEGFSALTRAVFQPQRIKLPEDET